MKKIFYLFLIGILCTNAKAQWYNLSSPYNGNMWAISFLSSTKGFIGSNTELISTNDGGVTWTSVNANPSYMISDFSWVNNTTGYYSASNNIIAKTTDGGITWSILDPNASPYAFNTVKFINTTGWAGGNAGTLRKTTNGGASWTSQNANVALSAIKKIHFFDVNTGILVAEGGKIRRTTNGGTTWTTIPSGTTGNLYDIHFVDNNIGFIAGANGYLAKTTNGGLSWSLSNTGITNHLYAVYFQDANTGYAGGYQMSMYKTTNGGLTWTQEIIPGLNVQSIQDITYHNGYYFAAGLNGRLVTTMPISSIDEINKFSISIYPNPFTDKTIFQFNNIEKNLTLKIVSADGKLIQLIENINTQTYELGAG